MIANWTEKIYQLDPKGKILPPSFAVAKVDLKQLRTQTQLVGDHTAEQYLTAREMEKFAELKHEKRKCEWLGGRIGVKGAAACLLTRQEMLENIAIWHKMIIYQDAHGKPFLQVDKDFFSGKNGHISLSHSADLAVGLACTEPCGVDIQEIKNAVFRVRRHFSTEAEQSILKKMSDFFERDETVMLSLLWSAKEAIKKNIALSPLLYFSEIRLNSIKQSAGAGLIFYFICSRKDKLPAMDCAALAAKFDKYSFAISRVSMPEHTHGNNFSS
ncbi:MAG: 4'-phosphopantetheinyl transferase superfamily protein [Thermodesulfobacteriota bacterium]|nr:4'-phosphopantetheinyl transferase superfamily protein [Thermodesulfobacteriota bacterium]